MALRVLRHESELGAWELVRRAPQTGLRGFVAAYEGDVDRGGKIHANRQQARVAQRSLIVNLGSSWAASDTPCGPREVHDSFFAGLFNRSTYVVPNGAATCVQVNLTPLGAHLLLGVPMREVVNRIVPLDDVVPRAWRTSTRDSRIGPT